MSRGLGKLQRHVCNRLYAAEANELSLRELRRRLGEPDRSNLRRAIRGLVERSLVEELRVGKQCRVKLTQQGILSQCFRPEVSRRPRGRFRTKRVEKRWRRWRAGIGEGPRWIGHEYSSVRRRRLGAMQARILRILWDYADPWDEGLPVTAVKAIVGGNRSNTRRAIRTLLRHGQLDESEDGKRIRLSFSTACWLALLSPMPKESIDDDRAREVIRKHQGDNLA